MMISEFSISILAYAVIIISVTAFLFVAIRPVLLQVLGRWPTIALYSATMAQLAILAGGAKVFIDVTEYAPTWLVMLVAIFSIVMPLALESTFSDIVSSGMLIARRVVVVGSFVEFDGDVGIVTRIDTSRTEILDINGDKVSIPNKEIVNGRIKVYNLSGRYHTMAIDVPAPFAHDPDTARLAIEQSALSMPDEVRLMSCRHSWEVLGDSVVSVYRCQVRIQSDMIAHIHDIRSTLGMKYAKAIQETL